MINNSLVRGSVWELPAKRRKRLILLMAIAALFNLGHYSEKEVNETISNFLSDVITLKVDFVTIRRAMVDEGFLTRTCDGSEYTVDRDSLPYTIFEQGVYRVDVLSYIRNSSKERKEKAAEFKKIK